MVNKRYDVINKNINYPDFFFGLSFTHKLTFEKYLQETNIKAQQPL